MLSALQESSESVAEHLASLGPDLAARDDVELLLVVPEDLDDHATGALHALVARSTTGAFGLVPVPAGADVATVMAAAASLARGVMITFLEVGDQVGEGYLSTLADTAVPNSIGVSAGRRGEAPGGHADHPEQIPQALAHSLRVRGRTYPTAVLRDVPAPSGLTAEAAEAILLARIVGTYQHQHLVLSSAPAAAGATHEAPKGSSGTVRDAVAGLSGLRREGDRPDREATRALALVWEDRLRRALADGSTDATTLDEALLTAGVDDLCSADLRGAPSPAVLEQLFSDHDVAPPTELVLVAADADKALSYSGTLRALQGAGVTLTIVHASEGDEAPAHPGLTMVDARTDGHLAVELLEQADHVIAVGRGSSSIAGEFAPDREIRVGISAVDVLLVDRAARSEAAPSLDRAITKSATRLGKDPGAAARVEGWTWAVLTLRLRRRGTIEAMSTVAATGLSVLPEDDPARPAIETICALAAVDDGGPAAVREAAVAAFARADAATDRHIALFHHYLGLMLLFEPTMHTSTSSTPLVSSPDSFLAPLRESTIHRAIVDPARRLPAYAGSTRPDKAVLLGGVFPKFKGVLCDALAADHDVVELSLAGLEGRFRTIEMDPRTFRQLDDVASGRPVQLFDRSMATHLMSAGTVVADWGDKGLALASRVVPEGTRLFARVHGVDTLSPWVHLTRWDRVTGVIAPSEHLARALRDVVGPALDDVEVHVVPNPVEADSFSPDKDETAPRTLGMIGWSQRVKDAGFALEVLALLRAEDPRWRLRLVGADFDPTAKSVEVESGVTFRARAARRDLAGAIEYVPFTPDVSSVMGGIGWALSTSLRESFHIGLLEMAASGAVPVVRDWPVYASTGGARDLFPADWVITDPTEAAERILAIDAADAWEHERRAARAHVTTHFDHLTVVNTLRRLFGEPTHRTDRLADPS